MRRVLVSLALTCWVVACGGSPPTPAPLQAPAGLRGTTTFYPAGRVPDETIVATTLRELGSNPATRGESVGVTSDAGILVLRASVTTQLAARRVLEIAHLVRGVRGIVNQVSVAVEPRPDHELQLAVEGGLGRDPATTGQRVLAQVEVGTVRLSGEVDSDAVRQAMLDDVLSVRGVEGIVDDLRVRGTTGSDAHLAAAVRRRISDDVWLDASRVRVDVRGGIVRLDGWVGSPLERARAEAVAWSAAPAAVDTRALQVARFADDGTLRVSPAPSRSDADLDQSLRDVLVHDGRVSPFTPTVDVHRGSVVLTGVAPNPGVARAVDADARNVPDVGAVLDYVKTGPAVYTQSDAELRHDITRAVESDRNLAGSYVTITVRDGRVYLRGTVPNDAARFRLLTLAAAAPATRDVADGLVVAPPSGGVGNMQRP